MKTGVEALAIEQEREKHIISTPKKLLSLQSAEGKAKD